MPVAVNSATDYRFEALRMNGAGFSLDVRVPGTMIVRAGRVAVRLHPRSP
jgi:hypothetical protein